MSVADAIVEVLKREGVSTLFCFPTTSIIENAVAAGIRPVICPVLDQSSGCERPDS
jgi:acetolactate synthase I/II/III large subunit